MTVTIRQYSGDDGYSGFSSPCGAIQMTLRFRWHYGRVVVACVSHYYVQHFEGGHYILEEGGTDPEATTTCQTLVRDYAFNALSLMMSSAGTPFITTHNTYYDFSGNNQAYNQFEISGDLLFAFCSSGNAIIGNFAYSKGVSRFHCYHGGREAVYSEMNHLHWNQSGIRNKRWLWWQTKNISNCMSVKPSIWKLGG